MDPEAFYDRFIARDFEKNFVPHAFEGICRQYLVRENRMGRLARTFEQIGKYWYDDPKTRTNGEFDVVTRDAEGFAFYEAKFRDTPINQAMVEQEIAQVEAIGLICHTYGFFSRSGFTAQADERTVFITLEQMYA